MADVKVDMTQFAGKSLEDFSGWTDDELKALRVEATRQSWQMCALSVSQKTFMNSIYGATGNAYYRFRHPYTAQDITAEGRLFIKSSDMFMNDWLKNHWHLETDLHAKLREHPELKNDFVTPYKKVEQLPSLDYVLYSDTDSIYVEFGQLIEGIGFTGVDAKFILILNDLRIREMFTERFDKQVNRRNGVNYWKFDLESIAEVAFFQAKKKYLLAYRMENDVIYDVPAEHIKGKGLEIIQSSTPGRVRKLISFLIRLIIEEKLNNKNIKLVMQQAFNVFSGFYEKGWIEDCSKLVGLNKYSEYVTQDDALGWSVSKGTLAQYKGVARYNHLIRKHKLTSQYHTLKNSKVAWYTDTSGQPFAYAIGNLPVEIAPPVDLHHQFDVLIVRPYYRLASLAGLVIKDIHSSQYEPELK